MTTEIISTKNSAWKSLVASCVGVAKARTCIFNTLVSSAKVFISSTKRIRLPHQNCLSPAQYAFVTSNKHWSRSVYMRNIPNIHLISMVYIIQYIYTCTVYVDILYTWNFYTALNLTMCKNRKIKNLHNFVGEQ